MKIVVTGGSGFIGCNFIRYMLNKYPDYKIINLDKLTYAGNPDNLKDVEDNPNYRFVKGDICDPKIVEEACEGADAIINFAAETHVDRSIGKPDDFIKTDIFGTYTLVEYAKNHNIIFVQISTDEVYGSIDEGSFTEEDKLNPSSPYSSSKAGGELLAMSYFVTYGTDVRVTRCTNNFGPYQYPEKLIPLFVTNVIEGKKLPVYGDGTQVRDWIYVLDHCEAVDLVLHKGKAGEVYNIGAGNEYQNIFITRNILKHFGKSEEEFIEYVKDRPGHDKRYSVDISKIMKLGWIPKHDFNSAMKETIEWYKNNEEWWKNIKSGEFKKYYEEHYKKAHEMKGD